MNDEMRNLIQIFIDRLVNHQGAYYQQWSNGTKYGYKAVYAPPTMETIVSHLQGDITIAAPALDENNCGKYICFDSDIDNGELDKLDCWLIEHAWATIREGKRIGKDGHLLLLFDAPVPGVHLVNLANAIGRQSGISSYKLDIFPRQAKADKLGSAVKLPLCFHQKIGARVWFDTPGIEKTILAQLRWFAQKELNEAREAIRLAELWKPLPQKRPVRRSGSAYKGKIDFKELAQEALKQSRKIVENWLPDGKGSTYYTALNPRRKDNRPGSFSVNLKTGLWKDFATDNAKGGDLISLVAYLENCSQPQAASLLANFLVSKEQHRI